MGLGAAIRRFRRREHGGVAIESAIAIVILVVGFAGLMEIVQASYADDRMARAARAAARSLALDPGADPKATACSAIQRELDLPEDFKCEPAWTLNVEPGVSPNSLPATLGDNAAQGTGDMVLVRIEWNREALSFGGGGHIETVPMVAIGLARCELELCGQI